MRRVVSEVVTANWAMQSSPSDTRLSISAAVAIGLLLCLAPAGAEASILVAKDSVDVEQILGGVEGNDSTSGSDRTPAPLKDHNGEDGSDQDHLTQLFTPNSSSGSSSSGTSSSGGSSGANSFALASGTSLDPDAELVAWFNGEQRFTLPMPPGNDLLRPPQEC